MTHDTTRAQGRKKSKFIEVTSVPAGGFQDIFQPGSNVKISFENFVAGLGVTGSIVQDGDPLGTPVLDTQGTVNNIRNMEDGPGVKFSVSPENGVTGAHNFDFDTVGVSLSPDPTILQPVMRSIKAGPGIIVSADGSQVLVSVGLAETTKTIPISQLSDLPSPVGGVITLLGSTLYLFINDVSLGTNRLLMGDRTVIDGSDSSIITLTYTGTGDMITSVDNTWRICRITLSCANGRVFNASSSGNLEFAQMIDMTITSCDKIGLCDNLSGLQLNNIAINSVATGGIEFLNNTRAIVCFLCAINITSGTVFDLGTSTTGGFTLETCFFSLIGAGTFLIDGATGSANINAGGLGAMINNRIIGAGTPLNGVSVNDALWNFAINDDIADTRTDALISMQANATNTVISVTSTPVLVAGTWAVQFTSQMTATTGGRATYDGSKDGKLPVTASLTVEPASGGNVQISAYIAINGVVNTASKRTSSSSAGTPASITIPWQHNFAEDDFAEVFVANESSTVDILVSSAILLVN